jgi:cell division protease FtsH
VERNYGRARTLLTENLEKLHAMADALMQYETLDAEQIEDIMAGRDPRPPADSDNHRGTGGRPTEGAGMRPRAAGIPAPQAFLRGPASNDREA